MKKLRWQILVVILALMVVGVLLLIQKPGIIGSVLPQPTSGGIYTEALVGSFGRLNPLFDRNNPADRDVDRLLFSSLLKFDERGTPQPDLAESWGISQDGMIYNFTLRANANWHDGQPVTSDDVIFTLELMRTQFTTYPPDVRAMWDEVQVTRLDDKNLKIILPEPFAPFLDYLTFGVLPEHLLRGIAPDQLINAQFDLAPVGSGPYRFEELMVEEGQVIGVVLTANDAYYGQKALISQIVFRYYPTSEDALGAYREGEVLGISYITTDVLANAMAEPNLSLYTSRLPRLSLVLFNLKDAGVSFFQDKAVRRALLYGLNRQWMVDHFLQGQAIVADSVLLPGTWAYYNGVEHIPYDPEKAQSMLKDAGYSLTVDGAVRVKEGLPLAFTLVYPDDELHARLAESIQSDWAGIGVGVTLKPVSYEALLDDYLTPHSYQAALVDLDLSGSPDPDPYPFWHQSEATGGQNYSQWEDRSASEYLEQARVIIDPDVRARLYRNFQVIFAREMPALPLYYPVYTYGVDVRVQGVQIAPLFDISDRFATISDWFLVTRRVLEETPTPTISP